MAKADKQDAPKKQGLTDMLAELDAAFEYAEAKKETLATVHASAAKATAEAQAVFEAVKADHQSRIQAAAQASDEARATLEKLRTQVNDRVGTLTGQPTDTRVSVK